MKQYKNITVFQDGNVAILTDKGYQLFTADSFRATFGYGTDTLVNGLMNESEETN